MSQCSITFDNNPAGVFFAGQLVSGTAVLTTTRPKTIRGIYILVQGAAKVRWTESQGKNSVAYTGHEQYLYSKTYVVGGQQADAQEHPAGSYNFNFQCQLPPQLPSSLIGQFGNIAFSVELTIERPWRFDNKFPQPFIVVSMFDLNLHPALKIPVSVEQIGNFYGLNCKAKQLKITYEMSARGYVSQQKVPFTVTVENNASFDCHIVRVEIKNYIQYTSHTPSIKSKDESRKVAETIMGSIPKESTRIFKGVILLPALSASTFNTCRIISVYYMVVVTVHTPFYRRKLQLHTPIIIGTIPFQDMQGLNNTTLDNPQGPISYVTYVGGIYILIKGSAEVKFAGGTGSSKVRYKATDVYFETKSYVIGCPNSQSIEYPPGVKTYTFEMQLPETIPTSLLQLFGNIEYFVQLVIDRPLMFDNKFKRGFTVISPFDLNNYPSYKDPIDLSESTNCRCLCTCLFPCYPRKEPKPIKMTCYIPYRAYVSGQRVSYRVVAENDTDIDAKPIKVLFEKITRFFSDIPSKQSKIYQNSIHKKKLGPVPRQSTKEFEGDFLLPCLPPSSLETCRIIVTEYLLRFELDLGCCRHAIYMKVPLHIGTYPFLETLNLPALSNQQHYEPFTYEKPFAKGNPYYMNKKDDSLIPKYLMFHYNSSNNVESC